MRVRPGTALRVWSDDAFGGVLRSVDDLSGERVDMRYVNPQSGLFYVQGAEPGDTLVPHFVSMVPAWEWGPTPPSPFFGGITGTDRVVTLQDPLPDTTWIYELDRDANTVTFLTRLSDVMVALPAPMLGTVGVAPAAGEVRTFLVPDRFGGNMDCPNIKAGATVRLGVNVEGRCSPSATGTTARARRGMRHIGGGSHDDDVHHRSDQGPGRRHGPGSRTTATG